MIGVLTGYRLKKGLFRRPRIAYAMLSAQQLYSKYGDNRRPGLSITEGQLYFALESRRGKLKEVYPMVIILNLLGYFYSSCQSGGVGPRNVDQQSSRTV
jgi:hypothetical protein